MWICGTDESIATSSDGEHWQVKHSKVDGAVLLNIAFANDQFGYAAGTGGLVLTTEDGGTSWSPQQIGGETILQVSFSDRQHGLIRTASSLLFTIDGGVHFSAVSAAQNSAEMRDFPYTFSLVALDELHMGIMLKHGAAQATAQRFLVTEDAGATWTLESVPSTTLYSVLEAGGKYWTVGTEVIHKERPNGGYAVPAALYSSNGRKWQHSANDITSCKLEMCVACTPRGCLSANGTITNPFAATTTYREFPPNSGLTAYWAATNSAICFSGNQLECAALTTAGKPGPAKGPLPEALAPNPLGADLSAAPGCVICRLAPVHDKAMQDMFRVYRVELSLEIARNGTVSNVTAEGTPTPVMKSAVEEQVKQWIFEPSPKLKALTHNLSVKINVTAIRSVD